MLNFVQWKVRKSHFIQKIMRQYSEDFVSLVILFGFTFIIKKKRERMRFDDHRMLQCRHSKYNVHSQLSL